MSLPCVLRNVFHCLTSFTWGSSRQPRICICARRTLSQLSVGSLLLLPVAAARIRDLLERIQAEPCSFSIPWNGQYDRDAATNVEEPAVWAEFVFGIFLRGDSSSGKSSSEFVFEGNLSSGNSSSRLRVAWSP